MYQPDLARWFGHGFYPVAQGLLVGMGGVSGQPVNGGFGRGAALHDGSARGASGLVSHKEQVVFRVVQAVFQVADNASARAHARSGNDDGRAVEVQQALVVLKLFHGIQVLEPDGVVPGGFQGFGFFVPALVHFLVQPGDPDAQRGIDEHGHAGVDAVQFIDQFLGPAQGKCRDLHDAIVGQGMVQGLCQGGLAVGPFFVVPVAIGGFQDQQVAGIGRVRVREDRGVFATQVSGKRDPV